MGRVARSRHVQRIRPNDRHYVVDEEAETVTFGDGTDGMIPPAGTNNVKATYRGGTYDWTLEKDDVPSFRTLTLKYGVEDHDVVLPVQTAW